MDQFRIKRPSINNLGFTKKAISSYALYFLLADLDPAEWRIPSSRRPSFSHCLNDYAYVIPVPRRLRAILAGSTKIEDRSNCENLLQAPVDGNNRLAGFPSCLSGHRHWDATGGKSKRIGECPVMSNPFFCERVFAFQRYHTARANQCILDATGVWMYALAVRTIHMDLR